MSEESEDDASKTEEPSQKKLDDARKKGQMVSSREINHFFMMLALTFFIFLLAPKMGRDTLELLAPFIVQPDRVNMDAAGLSDTMRHVSIGAMALLSLPLLLTFVAALAPSIVQRKWSFSAEQMMPKFSKISPISGFKRIFGFKALIEFLKNLLKIGVVGAAAAMVAMPFREDLPGLMRGDKSLMLTFAQTVTGKMMVMTCIILFLLSIFDYFYQRFVFMKSMRMTKQEMKDEYKQQEGDPHIKQKLKAIRREKARKRMMANVPKADVIITNPTHYAVALQYDPMTMPAPKVLAKGHDDVAMRIRELATKHKVPIVRNPPLARVLYDTTDIDDEIPVEHYQAVAKVIGYVYKLKGKTPPNPNMGKTKVTPKMKVPKKKK